MIVSTAAQTQSVLPSINFKVGPDRLGDFLVRAQEWVSAHIIGYDLESALEEPVATGQPDELSTLRSLVVRVICEHAYLAAVPEMDLQLSEAGFVVQNNERMSPASQQRVDRLVVNLKDRLDADCDALVKYLLDNSSEGKDYENWRGTFQFAYLTEAFIPTMAIMRQNCRQCPVAHWSEFHDLIPQMATSLRGTVADYISVDEVDELLELYRDQELLDVHKKALRLVRFAVMAEVAGLHDNAVHFAIEARNWMLRHEGDFPAFVESDRYSLPKPFNLGDGTVANLL